MPTHYDWLIVGAGYTGAVLAERLASQAGKRCFVIDRRPHIAGNAYDCRNGDGILIHKYGPHIFHTNSKEVWSYLSGFTDWRPYQHRVHGIVDGRSIPVPFNLTSLQILFPQPKAEQLTRALIEAYGLDHKVPILRMREHSQPEIRELADYIYSKIFVGYTWKQWSLAPEQLLPSVTGRVPIQISYDDRYFQDIFQCMPAHGYTPMFERMLSHPGIHLSLNTDLSDLGSEVTYDRLLYTGAIDEYFDYELGELPYRSLHFEFQTYRQRRHQAVGQVNYPGTEQYTRITEMRYLTGEVSDHTAVAVEFPMAHLPGKTVPYYPVPTEESQRLHHEYVRLATREAKNVLFAGRLGDFKYYNMDQAVARALSLFTKGLS